MKTTYVMVFVLWLVCSAGCEVKAKIAINSEQTDEYAEHYKHGDDVFYKGTFVVKETVSSILHLDWDKDRNVNWREYHVLGTDVKFQDEVVGSTVTHEKLLTLRCAGEGRTAS